MPKTTSVAAVGFLSVKREGGYSSSLSTSVGSTRYTRRSAAMQARPQTVIIIVPYA